MSFLDEVNRTAPFAMPKDRPLDYSERLALFKDLPEPLRAGPYPDDGTKSKAGSARVQEAWDRLRGAWKTAKVRQGWAFNRLRYDEIWEQLRSEEAYRVPDFCEPGAEMRPPGWVEARCREDARCTYKTPPSEWRQIGGMPT